VSDLEAGPKRVLHTSYGSVDERRYKVVEKKSWYCLASRIIITTTTCNYSIRTAVDNDGVLDKEATSYNDIFDAFRLSLKFYHYEESIS
jgi:hypothetical protein